MFIKIGVHLGFVLLSVAVFVQDAAVPAGAIYIDPNGHLSGFQLLQAIVMRFQNFELVLFEFISLTVVGLMESMMTATIVDDLTDTGSDKNRECRGQGIANVITGFFGGMAKL